MGLAGYARYAREARVRKCPRTRDVGCAYTRPRYTPQASRASSPRAIWSINISAQAMMCGMVGGAHGGELGNESLDIGHLERWRRERL